MKENPLQQIGRRIRETRTVLGIPPSEMAKVAGVSEDEYLRHEEGLVDSSFSFLYHCAERFGVDIGVLVTGESPKLSHYDLTRAGGGMPIRRRVGFEYRHLAPLLKHRQAEPFVVTAPPGDESAPITLTTHAGQEFDYVFSGRLKIQLGDRVEVLEPGDSVFYDSSRPHGMVAIGGRPCEFLALVVKGGLDAPEIVPAAAPAGKAPIASAREGLVCARFADETLDEHGRLASIRFRVPGNYNFAFDVVDALEAKSPDRTAMVWMDSLRRERIFSFGEIARESRRAANYLASLGIGRGDRVMLVLRRHYQFWIVLNALHRLGAVAIPATHLLMAGDYEYRFRRGRVKAIVCVDTDGVPDHVDEAEAPAGLLKILAGGTRPGWRDYDAECPAFGTRFERPAGQRAADIALMFFSSGTTGHPKLVAHDHTYSLGHLITARWWQNVDPDGLHLTVADTGWGKALWGKIYGQWLCESAVLTYDFDAFKAEDLLSVMESKRITSFCAPPTIYRFFIKEDLSRFDLSSIQHASTAGEALNPEVFEQFRKATGLTIMEAFGQTESTLLLGNLAGTAPKVGSMGLPSPAYHVDLVDEDGGSVPPGKVGEIVVRGSPGSACGLFLGYCGDDGEVGADAWKGGLYRTGDTAWRDEDGYYWFVGRIDDVIKSSGYRIGPFEIESVLMELPYVLECAVTGVPDPVRGQIVKASIVLRGREPSDELRREIQDYVKHRTAPYKYPRAIDFLDALPKTISGKIRRTELRKADETEARRPAAEG
ncbi:MAG: AMP-binding protein [Kiritimatiellia bacterium]|jgi:acetyl-CoA synthetase